MTLTKRRCFRGGTNLFFPVEIQHNTPIYKPGSTVEHVPPHLRSPPPTKRARRAAVRVYEGDVAGLLRYHEPLKPVPIRQLVAIATTGNGSYPSTVFQQQHLINIIFVLGQ